MRFFRSFFENKVFLFKRHFSTCVFHLRKWSMSKVLYHEPIAAGLFNGDFSSGVGPFAAWQSQLLNRKDVALLLVERMRVEYGAMPTRLRKPYGRKEVEP